MRGAPPGSLSPATGMAAMAPGGLPAFIDMTRHCGLEHKVLPLRVEGVALFMIDAKLSHNLRCTAVKGEAELTPETPNASFRSKYSSAMKTCIRSGACHKRRAAQRRQQPRQTTGLGSRPAAPPLGASPRRSETSFKPPLPDPLAGVGPLSSNSAHCGAQHSKHVQARG